MPALASYLNFYFHSTVYIYVCRYHFHISDQREKPVYILHIALVNEIYLCNIQYIAQLNVRISLSTYTIP